LEVLIDSIHTLDIIMVSKLRQVFVGLWQDQMVRSTKAILAWSVDIWTKYREKSATRFRIKHKL